MVGSGGIQLIHKQNVKLRRKHEKSSDASSNCFSCFLLVVIKGGEMMEAIIQVPVPDDVYAGQKHPVVW